MWGSLYPTIDRCASLVPSLHWTFPQPDIRNPFTRVANIARSQSRVQFPHTVLRRRPQRTSPPPDSNTSHSSFARSVVHASPSAQVPEYTPGRPALYPAHNSPRDSSSCRPTSVARSSNSDGKYQPLTATAVLEMLSTVSQADSRRACPSRSVGSSISVPQMSRREGGRTSVHLLLHPGLIRSHPKTALAPSGFFLRIAF